MCGSFLLLWGWFLAQKAAENAHKPLSLVWQAALLLAFVALVFITVRRVKRVQQALRGEDEEGNATPMYPMFGQGPPSFGQGPPTFGQGPPSTNGKHPKEKH